MNRILAAIALITVCGIVSAQQEPAVTWGKEIENNAPGKNYISKILFADVNSLLVLREEGSVSNHHYTLEKYDKSFNRIFSTDITPSAGVMGNSQLVIKVLYVKDKVLVMCQGWKKADKTGSCLAFEVDKDGVLSKQSTVLDAAPAEREMRAADYRFAVSPDNTKLLVLTELPEEKDANGKARLKCFDAESMKELWKNDIDFGMPSGKGLFHTLCVADNGDAYLFKKWKLEKNTWKYSVFSFTAGNMNRHDLDFGDKVINNETARINSNGNALIFGTYATGRFTGKESQGFISIIVDGVAKSAKQNDSVWPSDITTAFKDNTIGGKANSIIPLDVKYVENRVDGSVIVMFETNKTESTAVPGQSFVYNYNRTSGNALFLCIGNDGKMQWNSILPKQQNYQSQSDRSDWTGFVYGMMENRLLVFYPLLDVAPFWDNEKGARVYKKDIFGARVVNPTCMISIDESGKMHLLERYYGWKNVTGKPLLKFMDTASLESSLQPALFYPIENGVIVYSENPSQTRYKFGMIKL